LVIVEITEVRIKLAEGGGKLHAYCSITLDGSFVVRDLKIIGGPEKVFVAMPSRKQTTNCPQCGLKNHLRSRYCNWCGRPQDAADWTEHYDREELYAPIAHPINSACREMIEQRILHEYQEQLRRMSQSGNPASCGEVEGKAASAAPPC
jgi:stage V sporulation protein G